MNKEFLAAASTQQVDELCENIEVVGPGLMLSEARKKLSLSTEDVGSRLNFRTNLVHEIEQDIFDPSLPVTFYRGYLRNYAKLVAVDIDEVLSAYDMLGVTEVQRSEMQSFSKLTIKQAEHSRLMWFSYLVVALLFGLMVLWWLQDPKLSINLFDQPKQEQSISNNISETADVNVAKKVVEEPGLPVESAIAKQNIETVPESKIESIVNVNSDTALVADVSTVVFTFSGDCWVNIFDATGERIAWGVKKSGYVMTIAGKAPFKVTLGKPELAVIAFNGEQVDMSSFNVGNIAKFTLPLISQ
ncbi:MAG TPA: DUF4115 domain-containing protein [Colwellia sp.]|nr:DUF4115 domain-containing protein [Colwellia sp.]